MMIGQRWKKSTEDTGKMGTNAGAFVREGADRRTVGIFHVAVVQEVLLFWSEIWVMTPQLEKALKGLHNREVGEIAGTGPKCQQDGT